MLEPRVIAVTRQSRIFVDGSRSDYQPARTCRKGMKLPVGAQLPQRISRSPQAFPDVIHSGGRWTGILRQRKNQEPSSLRKQTAEASNGLIWHALKLTGNAARLTVPGGPSVACSTAKAVEWDASWSKNLDPSGRAALGHKIICPSFSS
ncbi:hypothetical protein Tco_0483332 [Tanacetum coccineum]